MHIPDGVLDARTCVVTALVSAGAVGYCLRRVEREMADRAVPLMGVTAAFLFAAQMLNFPIPGGTSGHLLGGVLAAVLLGPWGGALVLSIVLFVQSVLFQDGGITALGANILNVGVLGCMVGFAIYEPLRRRVGGLAGIVAGASVAAWFCVTLGAILCSLELSFGGQYRLAPTLGAMLLAHSMIGVGESLITALTLSFILRTRPDLIYSPSKRANALQHSGQIIAAGLAIALVFATFLSPLASSMPDGLERSLEKLGSRQASGAPVIPTPWAGYTAAITDQFAAIGSLSGAVGTVVVFGLTIMLARRLPRAKSPDHISHASRIS